LVRQTLHFTDIIPGFLSLNLTKLYKYKNPLGCAPNKIPLISTSYFNIQALSYKTLHNILTSHTISKLFLGPVHSTI